MLLLVWSAPVIILEDGRSGLFPLSFCIVVVRYWSNGSDYSHNDHYEENPAIERKQKRTTIIMNLPRSKFTGIAFSPWAGEIASCFGILMMRRRREVRQDDRQLQNLIKKSRRRILSLSLGERERERERVVHPLRGGWKFLREIGHRRKREYSSPGLVGGSRNFFFNFFCLLNFEVLEKGHHN